MWATEIFSYNVRYDIVVCFENAGYAYNITACNNTLRFQFSQVELIEHCKNHGMKLLYINNDMVYVKNLSFLCIFSNMNQYSLLKYF